jgi:hypothetical protein
MEWLHRSSCLKTLGKQIYESGRCNDRSKQSFCNGNEETLKQICAHLWLYDLRKRSFLANRKVLMQQ